MALTENLTKIMTIISRNFSRAKPNGESERHKDRVQTENIESQSIHYIFQILRNVSKESTHENAVCIRLCLQGLDYK